MSSNGSVIEFFPRKYLNDPITGGLVFDENGNITNEMVWEDPKIALGENRNVILDGGGQGVFYNMFAMAGSAIFQFMAYGASSTAAVHTQTQLFYEHILDGTRIKLTNTNGTPLSNTAVSLTTFTDANYTPSYVYYRQCAVLGTVPSTTLNVNQPVSEIAIVAGEAVPATPSTASGVYLDRYVFGSPTILDGATSLAITILLHF